MTQTPLRSIPHTWGSTAAERRRWFVCDDHLPAADTAYYRAVDVQAPPEIVFRWLCQLRAAPYSYDWIDNFGRRSPTELTPGLDELEVGQSVMTIFELVEFQRDRHLTIRLKRRVRRLAGDFACTYLVLPVAPGRSRLVVKLLVRYPRARPLGAIAGALLPTGDLVMMRKQLLTLKRLAEDQAPRVAASSAYRNEP